MSVCGPASEEPGYIVSWVEPAAEAGGAGFEAGLGGADDEPRPCLESAFIVVPHPEFSRQGWPWALGWLRVANILFLPSQASFVLRISWDVQRGPVELSFAFVLFS